MVLIFALPFLFCNGIFMWNPYFHFAKPRGSVEDHFSKNGLECRSGSLGVRMGEMMG